MGAALLSACGGGGSSASDAGAPAVTPLSAPAALGEKIFADVSLSASGKQACASCHRPDNAHAPANNLGAQLGGPLLDQQGRRQAPSTSYLSFNTAFFFVSDGTPTGGFFWNSRAASLLEQAGEPFVNPFEMANASVAEVIGKLSHAAYAADFKAAFGAAIFTRPDDAVARARLALSRYRKEHSDFRAFSSKYDEFLRSNLKLSEPEMRGIALFNNPTKGNRIGGHPSGSAVDGSFPMFTDFTYDNLGVPRNPAIARNDDPHYYDLGLCEPADLASHADLCGASKVPLLRNVAQRHVFFHNGRFSTPKEAITFYVQRDTNPEKWCPLNADGSVRKFDDLPVKHHANLDTVEVPYNRRLGEAPALSDAEVDGVIVFLQALNDGYKP